MVPGETIEDQIKTADKTIDAAARDRNITGDESIKINAAKDFLKNKTLDKDENIKKKAKEIYEDIEHKTKIGKGINTYFDLKEDKLTEEGQKKINDLSQGQIQSYLNVIERVKTNAPGETAETSKSIDEEIKKGIDILVVALNKKRNAVINAETAKDKNTLEDNLESNPSIDRAKALFEDNEAIWKSIFTHQKNGVLALPEDPEKTEKSFSQNLQIYSGCTIGESGKLGTYQIGLKAEDITSFSYKIKTSDGGDVYTKNDKYIQVTIDVAGIKVIKDIMFGKEVKIIEKARADKSYKENTVGIAENKILSSDNIKDMHGTGSYEYLRQLVANNKIDLEKSLAGGLLSSIKTFYTNPTQDITLKDGTIQKTALENKEDGYYTTIAELVVTKAKAGDLKPIKEYLKHVNKDNLQYLGKNKVEQEKNMKILLSAVTENPGYNQEQWKDINTALLEINIQIFPTQDILTQAKNGLKGIFDQHGEKLIKFLNFLGIGKSFLYKICKAVGIDFKEVDEYYTKAYGLSKEATEASNTIEESYKDKEWDEDTNSKATPKELIKPIDASTLQNIFENKIGKDFPKGNEKKFLENMNPALLSKLIEKHNTADTDKNDQIKEQDILIRIKEKDNKEKLEIKKDAITNLSPERQSSLIKILLADEGTWSTIREANTKIRGDNPEGKKEAPRSELTPAKRNEMMINKPSDIVKYLNYYAFSGKTGDLDYVITETKETEKTKITYAVKGTDNAGANFRDEKGGFASTTTIPENSEVEAVLDTDGKEIIKRGSDIGLPDKADLKDKEFIKVKSGGIEGYVAEKYLEKKEQTEATQKIAEKKDIPVETAKFTANEQVKTNEEKINFRPKDSKGEIDLMTEPTLIATKGTEMTVVDPTLITQNIQGTNYNFIKVKYMEGTAEKEGYVAQNFLDKKST